MSSSDFRQITIKSERHKAERLFRAAVSAFCSLTRPSRREIAQLEDLALPLFDLVSVESKRYVAAALSECAFPPAVLIRRLCDESADIAAPLLIRSAALSDIDLIALIGRHGYGHARAIGRRPGLNPTIAKLVAALENKVVPLRPVMRETEPLAPTQPSREPETIDEAASGTTPAVTADDVRRQLRAMMRPASFTRSASNASERSAYDRLRDTALSGHAAFFQTALADALEMEFAAIREMAGHLSYDWLLDALRMLDVSDEKAFLVTAAIYPSDFGELQAIRLFLSRYDRVTRDAALERLARWKTEAAEAQTPLPLTLKADSDVSPVRVAG